MLHVDIPDQKLDPFVDGDEVATLIEHFIGEAEKQIRGIHRGQERLDAVTDAVVQSVKLPTLIPKKVAQHMVQVLYHRIAKNLPDNLRSSTAPPSPPRR